MICSNSEIFDCRESGVTDRADDGAHESIVPGHTAEHAVLNSIRRMFKISPVTLRNALKEGSEEKMFTLSGTRTSLPPLPEGCSTWSLAIFALLNVKELVMDVELTVEDHPLGVPVLRHLIVDTKVLLEERRDRMDGSDCSRLQLLNC